MADERPIQHTPKHLEEDADVFDPKHPAASAFAPAQPAAGVVADDVEEKAQNLRGGTTASKAQGEYSDQKEVLAEQHDENLRQAAGVTPTPANVEGGAATPADTKSDTRTDTKSSDAKSSTQKPTSTK